MIPVVIALFKLDYCIGFIVIIACSESGIDPSAALLLLLSIHASDHAPHKAASLPYLGEDTYRAKTSRWG
jgi:hypothetical protein